MRRPKAFGIGLSKTGTTSLHEALELLNYEAKDLPSKWKHFEIYDAATDASVADVFELLDRRFPGSKFIYTTRDQEKWLASCQKHWRLHKERIEHPAFKKGLHERLYGTLTFNRELFIQAYQRHDDHVRKYFSKRPEDLLILDICSGNARWDELCSFLEVPIPDRPFPCSNKAVPMDGTLLRLLQVIGDAGKIAEITRMSTQYIQDLSQSSLLQYYDMKDLFDPEHHPKIEFALANACDYFGGIGPASEKLNMSSDRLKEAVRQLRQQKIDKRIKKLKLNMRWQMSRVIEICLQNKN